MEAALGIGSEVCVPVGIDRGQFIVCDPEAELDIDSYDEAAQRDGLALWGTGGGLTVFTASAWTRTNVTVALSADRPAWRRAIGTTSSRAAW